MTATEYILKCLNEKECKLINPKIHEESFIDILSLTDAFKGSLAEYDKSHGFHIEVTADNCDNYPASLHIKEGTGSNYNYYLKASCICDGTLIFFLDLANEIIRQLLNASYCKSVFDPIEQNIKDYEFVYEIGKLVVIIEYGDEIAPDDKKWMCSRFSIFLPIKFSALKIE